MGKEVSLSEELSYSANFDYWVKINKEKSTVSLGLTPTGNIKEGEYCSIEFVVSEGEEIACGDVFAVAITSKIKYLESIVTGKVLSLNTKIEEDISLLKTSTLDDSYFVEIHVSDSELESLQLLDLDDYIKILTKIEDGSAPPGTKGGLSPTCKSVYEAVKRQKS